MTVDLNRKEVEMIRKRVPLTKILHGREFSEILSEMKKFRQQFAEQEVLYKAKIHFVYQHGEAMAIVRRPETDSEYSRRIEAERKAEEEKAERKRIRDEKARARELRRQAEAEAEAEKRRQQDIELVKQAARKLGLTVNDLVDI